MHLLLTLFLSLSAFAAKELSVSEVKGIFCPFSSSRAKKALDAESLEHGGLEEIKRSLGEQIKLYGKCLGLKELEQHSYELSYQGVAIPLDLTYGEAGKIRAFFFGMPRHADDSPAKIAGESGKLPYTTAYLFMDENGREFLSRNADRPLNVSRSSQVFLLAAAQKAIREGELRLSDTATLRSARAVRAMGAIHGWRNGTLLTVDTLLNLMMGERDMAAADLLLEKVGRDAPASFGARLSPFLSHREFFLLAESEKSELSSPKKIRSKLAELEEKPLPELYRLDRLDLVPVLGWFASAREICRAALGVKEEVTELNARLSGEYSAVQPKSIERFGLVQTRDSGVSQVTAVLKAKGQPWACLAITANHGDEIEEGFFSGIYSRILNLGLELQKKAAE